MSTRPRPAGAGPIQRIRLNDHTRERMQTFNLSFPEIEHIINHGSSYPASGEGQNWHQGESTDGRTFNIRTRISNLDLVVTRIDRLSTEGG